VPPEVEQAIDKRSSMSAVGNLNDYVKFQMAQGMEKGGGAGGIASEMAVGLAMAQQMVQQGLTSGPPAPTGFGAAGAAPAPAAAAGPDLLSVADAAKVLGVSEADVQAVLDSGELVGKKIGTTWRIKRSAIDQYLSK